MDAQPQTSRRARRVLMLVLVAASVVLYSVDALATSTACCCPLRQQDQLWLVSDRGLGCNVECNAERLQYWRYDCQRRWTRSSLDELLSDEDPQMSTTVFVHGNRIPSDEAYTKGWSAYRALVRCAGDQPVRFIIWSWPSAPVHGLVEDARLKANRTNVTGYYIAWFLDRLHPQTPLSLWAHSYGARAVTGALHLLGGGVLCGRVLEDRVHPERDPAQVALLAAALDNHWLRPGSFHGQAMSQTAGLLLVNNSCDRLLRRYHMIYGRRSCAEALGYTGMSCWCFGEEACKVQQFDACCQIGKRHLFALYLESPSVMMRVRDTLLDGFGSVMPTVPEELGPESASPETAESPDPAPSGPKTTGPEIVEAMADTPSTDAAD